MDTPTIAGKSQQWTNHLPSIYPNRNNALQFENGWFLLDQNSIFSIYDHTFVSTSQ